jgi:hypothetical protein
MRGTLIVYANPNTFQLLAEDCRRFYGHRTGLLDRLQAAWLVFSGKADALSWTEVENGGERRSTALLPHDGKATP